MPAFRNGEISLAFDICGCPNRCRHCWLGQASTRGIDLQRAVELYRELKALLNAKGGYFDLTKVKYFSTYFREPHYCEDYRRNRDLELELNGGSDYAADYQLLSVWRLAHDHSYASWAKTIGTKKCQIALFGLEQNNDWFYRRKGAHQDIISGTSRLIEAGIQPRWMVFLTKRGLPDFEGVLDLVDHLHLRDRVSQIGGDFELFLNDPTPIGEAESLQDIRLTLDDISRIPHELIASTQKYTKKLFRPKPESEWIDEMLSEEDIAIGLDYPNDLWFYITPDWDVYSNVGSMEPWWRLGNLLTSSWEGILSSFLRDRPVALRASTQLTRHEATRKLGEPDLKHLYLSKSDLYQLWLEKHSRNLFNESPTEHFYL